MPPKESEFSFLQRMVKKFREELVTDGKVLHCSICNEVVKCEKKSQVTQHRLTKKHSSASGRHSAQQLVSTFNTASKKPKSDDYSAKLCNALIAADIPFNKLKNPIFRLSHRSSLPSKPQMNRLYEKVTYRSCTTTPYYSQNTMWLLHLDLSGWDHWCHRQIYCEYNSWRTTSRICNWIAMS